MVHLIPIMNCTSNSWRMRGVGLGGIWKLGDDGCCWITYEISLDRMTTNKAEAL